MVIPREMQTSQTDLSRDPIKVSTAIQPCIARAPVSVAEKNLIAGKPYDQGRQAAQAKAEPPRIANVSYRLPTPGSRAPHEGLSRARDIILALLLIILLLPVFALLVLLVIAYDPGPPIFAHVRVGKDGRLFKCYKLRSMYRDAEQRLIPLLASQPALRREWEATFKLTNDPRVTPFGAFLRRSSLDELPQLFNVLNGTMTLVGPRPVVRDELRQYGRHASAYLKVKPGLTGLWQVTGRSEVSYRRRVATDRLYAHRKSLALDFQILLATIPAVLTRKGAW
jgi:lipopolysaccharide/colanic/teichoic acid biosynthesis glycosyltransferase